MEIVNQPLVSVPIVTYNSSKTILETLESIKAQTYPNLELIISDDCSKDNTVEICHKWVEQNKGRFIRTQIITIDKNTGVSANFNRAGAACHGEWVKEIAGDDLLTPDCIEVCLAYAIEHNSVCLFGKIEAFGDDREYASRVTETFSKRNDEMSKMTNEELYDIIAKGKTPPAPACFINRKFFTDHKITNDDRIPMIEDLPKWLNVLKTGIRFDFIDHVVVKYRLGGISTSNRWMTPVVYANQRKMYFYYQFEYLYQQDKESTIEDLIQHEIQAYESLYNEVLKTKNSKAYKLGKLILSPFKSFCKIWKKVKK